MLHLIIIRMGAVSIKLIEDGQLEYQYKADAMFYHQFTGNDNAPSVNVVESVQFPLAKVIPGHLAYELSP